MSCSRLVLLHGFRSQQVATSHNEHKNHNIYTSTTKSSFTIGWLLCFVVDHHRVCWLKMQDIPSDTDWQNGPFHHTGKEQFHVDI